MDGLLTQRAAGLRTFEPDDVAEVAALRRRCFQHSRWRTTEDEASYFHKVFFENPWRADDLPALVYQTGNGIAGFFGVIPRPLELDGQPVRGGVLAQMMVGREHRGSGIAQALVRGIMDGPQDFVFADVGNQGSERRWLECGGSTATIYRYFWSCSLHPAADAAADWGTSLGARVLRFASRPLQRGADARFSAGARRTVQAAATGRFEPLDAEVIAKHAGPFAPRGFLRPHYEAHTLQWVFDQVALKSEAPLDGAIVRDDAGDVAGWFIYVKSRHRRAQVVHMCARPGRTGFLLDHLMAHAWSSGADSINGRFNTTFADDYAVRRFRFSYEAPRIFVHARDPRLVNLVLSGRTTLTGIDGEWWMSF